MSCERRDNSLFECRMSLYRSKLSISYISDLKLSNKPFSLQTALKLCSLTGVFMQ